MIDSSTVHCPLYHSWPCFLLWLIQISWMPQYTCNNLADTGMSTHRYSVYDKCATMVPKAFTQWTTCGWSWNSHSRKSYTSLFSILNSHSREKSQPPLANYVQTRYIQFQIDVKLVDASRRFISRGMYLFFFTFWEN